MIINLHEYMDYFYIDKDGRYIAFKNNPKNIQDELREINDEYKEFMGIDFIYFEEDDDNLK